MRLKYLTLCVLGLSLSACSQHVIKTNSGTASLGQKAINSLNAMYEYPSYDYRGKFKVHIEQGQEKAEGTVDKAALNAALKQKVEQYLQSQKVTLNDKQKQALYVALAQEQKQAGRSKADTALGIVANILNDMQFEYDGSVHYRQKMGSFNLTARYEKPTLLLQAKVPMVLDLNEYKFYVNYFALMPYLVNKDHQNELAYLDFSKYQDVVKQVDYKKLVEYIKTSGAVYYRLADQNNIQALSLSSADRTAGVVEKIRLKSTIEELILQASLYSKVNAKYLTQILNINEKNLDSLIAEQIVTANKTKAEASSTLTQDSADDASVVSQQLYHLVNQHFGVAAEEEDEVAIEEAADDQAEEARAAVDAALADNEQQEADGLTEAQCTALQNTPKTSYGDLQYCQAMYDIGLLDTHTQKIETGFLSYMDKVQALEKQFAAYDQGQFMDDQAFKALWFKHQADIDKALPPIDQRNPFIMDVGLDAQGRAVKVDYDFNYALVAAKSQFNIKADLLISNYGKATPIDQAQLKRAKTWAEASKGSLLEKAISGFTEKLGQAGIEEHSAQAYSLSLDDQLKAMAEQRYDATHSYEQSFKAVFIAKLTEISPQVVQHYSTQELQEIASVYAYWYADEEIYNPKGKALKAIEALQNKHHLKQEDQFNDKLGQAVDRLVSDAIRGDQDRQELKKLKAQYKQPQQLFAKQYQIQFERDNGVSADEKILLEQTANILGQVYIDAHKNQLSEVSIKSLKIEHNEFIDYEIFKNVYQKVSNVK